MRTMFAIGCAALAATLPLSPAGAADYPAGPRYSESRTVVVAHERDPAHARGYSGRLPACDDPQVLGRVTRGFVDTERTYWGTGLELTAFSQARELGYRSWGASFIPRRFCAANVWTNDGKKRRVSYNMAEWQAPGSFSYGVEWCVSGLDRQYAYAPDCKMARP